MRIGIVYDLVEDDCRDADSFNEVLVTVKEIEGVLFRHGHSVYLCQLGADIDMVWRQLYKLRDNSDLVFNLAEAIGTDTSKESVVARMMADLGIVYTGCSHDCLELTVNKVRVKEIMKKAGILTPAFQVFSSADYKLALGFPLIVKPSREGGSIGICADSVVSCASELEARVREILEDYGQPALVEEFISGFEFNVGLLGNDDVRALPVSEIVFTYPQGMPNILTYKSKWDEESIEYIQSKCVCPAQIDVLLAERISSVAKKVFWLLGCRDYARVDFRVRGNDIFVLEANANPCINPADSGFARQIKAAGLNYEDLVLQLLDLAKERLDRQKHMRTDNLSFERTGLRHMDYLLRWFNDRGIGRYMDSPDEVYTEERLLPEFMAADSSFMVLHSGIPIGYCSFYDIDNQARRAEISFLIGEKEYQGRGFGKEIVRFLVRFGFECMGLNSLYASAAVPNVPSIRSLERAGFKRIGVRRDYSCIGGNLVDEVLLDMTAADYARRSARLGEDT